MWRYFLLGGAFFLNALLFYMLMWGTYGIEAYKESKLSHKERVQEAEMLKHANQELSREIRLLQTDAAYIERVIRKRFHFVRDNEVMYLFPQNATQHPSGAASDEGQN